MYILQYLALFLTAITLVDAQNEQLCPCSKIHVPVCGVDGHTYANRCLAECSYVVRILIEFGWDVSEGLILILF